MLWSSPAACGEDHGRAGCHLEACGGDHGVAKKKKAWRRRRGRVKLLYADHNPTI